MPCFVTDSDGATPRPSRFAGLFARRARTMLLAGCLPLAGAVVAATVVAPRAGAQASPYVPLEDIAYKYADALIARGALKNVSALERPYTAHALAIGADSVLAKSRNPVIRSYALALQTALVRYGDGMAKQMEGASDPSAGHLFINGDLFMTGQTSGIRDLMQADTSNSVTGGAGIRVGFTAGPLVMMLHPIADNRLNNDPQFGGRKDRDLAGRTQDAYVGGQWTYAQLFLGRIGRNWGPSDVDGLEVGNYAYSYDHLYALLGTDKLHISSLAAKLDDDFETDGVHARYFYAHRLAGRWRSLELGINEAYVTTGVGRSYDLSLMNPLNVYSLSWRNEKTDGNLNVGGSFALRTDRFGMYSGELFFDDVQIDRCKTTCKEPSSYGATFAIDGVPLLGEQRAFASYTRLTALAYRTPNPAEQYSSFGVGLGQGFSDYDEVRAGVDLAVIPYLTTKVYGAYRRQGEGDFHLPFPPVSAYPSVKGFLMGTVEHVSRVGIVGGMMLAPGLEVTGDGGVNHATNAGHVNGKSNTMFEGRIRLQWTPRGWSGSL